MYYNVIVSYRRTENYFVFHLDNLSINSYVSLEPLIMILIISVFVIPCTGGEGNNGFYYIN